MMCLLSLGSRRSRRHGPLMTCGGCWLLDDVDPRWSLEPWSDVWCRDAGSEVVPGCRRSSRAVLSRSVDDLDGPVIDLGPSLGGDTNSL